MDIFTIKDLENFSGVKAHTIRIWEQRYHFLKPRRTTTNIRYYNADELKTVLNIALLNKYGYKISHINRMSPTEIRERILSLNEADAIRERIVNDLIQLMVDLNIPGFEQILSEYTRVKGIEKTVIQVLFPFLERTGLLWESGNLNVVMEQLVVNSIRQKLIVAIETTVSHITIPKTFLLFLPEGEHNELGLLFIYYLLRSRGAATIYLGANVPLKDVEYVLKVKKPDIAFVHITENSSLFNFESFFQFADKKINHTPLIVSGQVSNNGKKIPSNIILKKTTSEVLEYISSLS